MAERTRLVPQQYFERIVAPAVRRTDTTERRDEVFRLTLEEVPKIVALLRGPIGFDCSSSTVPYYALLTETRVFWIHRGDKAGRRPVGYLLMTEVEVDGQIVPYVITVNGDTLRSSEVRGAALHVAGLYGGDRLLIGNASSIVNRSEVREGLWGIDPRFATRVPIRLSRQWRRVDQGRTDGYYSAGRLSTPSSITLDATERAVAASARVGTSPPSYVARSFADLSRLDRAVLAGGLPTPLDHASGEDLLAVRKLVSPWPAEEERLSPARWREVSAHFAIPPAEALRYLSARARISTLVHAFAERAFDLMSEAELVQRLTVVKTRYLSAHDRVMTEGSVGDQRSHLDVLVQLPDLPGTYDYLGRRYTRDLARGGLLSTLAHVPRWTRAQRRLVAAATATGGGDRAHTLTEILKHRETLSNAQMHALAEIATSRKLAGALTEPAAEAFGRRMTTSWLGARLARQIIVCKGMALGGLVTGLLERPDHDHPLVRSLVHRAVATSDGDAGYVRWLRVVAARSLDDFEQAEFEATVHSLKTGSHHLGHLLEGLDNMPTSRLTREDLREMLLRITGSLYDRGEPWDIARALSLRERLGPIDDQTLAHLAERLDRSRKRGLDHERLESVVFGALLRRPDLTDPEWQDRFEYLVMREGGLVRQRLLDHLRRVDSFGPREVFALEYLASQRQNMTELTEMVAQRPEISDWPPEVRAAVREYVEGRPEVLAERRLRAFDACEAGLRP